MKRKVLLLAVLASVVLILDLWTKALAVEHLCVPLEEYQGMATCMRPAKVVHVIDGFFSLRYVENRGAAWGIGKNLSEAMRKFLFVGVSSVAVLFLIFFAYRAREDQTLLLSSLGLVLGGALGNLADRVRYGYVIDFVEWYVGDYKGPWHWPTFNIADAAIVVGIGLLAIEMFKSSAQEQGSVKRED